MRVLILHNEVTPEDGPDARDVLAQVAWVEEALAAAGHASETLAVGLDLEALRRRLVTRPPAVVWNLVESLGGHDRLIHVVPALLDCLGMPYVGAPSVAIFLTTSKLLTKERLLAAGLPTPELLATWPPETDVPALPDRVELPAAIVKPVWDHGSPHLADDAVLPPGPGARLRRRLEVLHADVAGPCFAEAYVAGRELNLSLLAAADATDGVLVLPPAEIVFRGFPAGKPRIVGFAAKWRPTSFEYRRTPRRFDFPPADQPLLAELSRLARRAWHLFGLHGWARVDFRVDDAGRPFILELNVNPCLAPDAGFAAALERAGIDPAVAVERLLADALARGDTAAAPLPRAAAG